MFPRSDTRFRGDYTSYPLTAALELNKSLTGLSVAVLANDTFFSSADLSAMLPLLNAVNVSATVVSPYFGELVSGINATASYITTSSIFFFFDAVFIGSAFFLQGPRRSHPPAPRWAST